MLLFLVNLYFNNVNILDELFYSLLILLYLDWQKPWASKSCWLPTVLELAYYNNNYLRPSVTLHTSILYYKFLKLEKRYLRSSDALLTHYYNNYLRPSDIPRTFYLRLTRINTDALLTFIGHITTIRTCI